MPDHVLCDGGLGDINAQHLELPVHARCAPQGILLGELANEGADLRGDRGPATTASPCMTRKRVPTVTSRACFSSAAFVALRNWPPPAVAMACRLAVSSALASPRPKPITWMVTPWAWSP